jgi:hypothetical protein
MKKLILLALMFTALAGVCSAQGFALPPVPAQKVVNGATVYVAPVPKATVTICNTTVVPQDGAICSPLATIYNNITLTGPAITNPTNADANGNINNVYVASGNYVVTISGFGITSHSYSFQASGGSAGNPGGSNGQLQYNNGGFFGGFTMSGSCTLVVPTITCTQPTFDSTAAGLAQPTFDGVFIYPLGSNLGLELSAVAPNSVSTTPGTSGINVLNVFGQTGGATTNATGTGGPGGAPNIFGGVGGAGAGTNANGGSGGQVLIGGGTGGGGNGTGNNGSGGNVVLQVGQPGSGGSGSSATLGQVQIIGPSLGTTSNAQGESVGTMFKVFPVSGQNSSNAAGTAGAGSTVQIFAGNGGNGTGTNAQGGSGAQLLLESGSGGSSNGTANNANGANVNIIAGLAGTGGSGSAGSRGVINLESPTDLLQYADVSEISAPANPASGFERWYANNSTHQPSCLTSAGGNCLPSSGGTNITVNGGSALTSPVNFQNGPAQFGVTLNAINPSGSNVDFQITAGSDLTVPGGGTGAATFAAHGVLLGEGTSAFGDAAPSATPSQCFMSAASAPTTTDPSFQNCPSGFSNPMTTLGDIIYENATPAAARLAGCTLAVSVPCTLISTPTSGPTAAAPVWGLSGVPVDATNPATLLVTDRANYIKWSSGTALALPAVATTFASNLPFAIQDIAGATLTITPNAAASDLIDSAASGTLLNNFFAFVYQDSTTAPGHWWTAKMPTFAAFGSTCPSMLTWSTTTGIGCNAALPNGDESTNTVTAASAASAAKQLCVSSGASKTCSYIDMPERFNVPAANCNNATAGAGWSIGSGGTVTCRAGTNNLGGFIAITDTAATFATFQVTVPEDWDTGTNPYVRFYLASTDTTSGHTIIPSIQVACYKGDGSTTDDVAANAAHSSSTVTLNTTANQFWSNSNVQMNSTDVTGCVAGATMQITIGRATDTATNARFYAADVTFPRLIAVQAN